jgi:hypothetical protein
VIRVGEQQDVRILFGDKQVKVRDDVTPWEFLRDGEPVSWQGVVAEGEDTLRVFATADQFHDWVEQNEPAFGQPPDDETNIEARLSAIEERLSRLEEKV